MNFLSAHYPHLHTILFAITGLLVLYKLNTVIDFIKECLSEPDSPLGVKGKGSSKRLILFLFATGFIYGWIFSLHSHQLLDHYVCTAIIIFLSLGLAILKPEQLNILLDKVGSLKNILKEEKSDKTEQTTIKSNTETVIETPKKD